MRAKKKKKKKNEYTHQCSKSDHSLVLQSLFPLGCVGKLTKLTFLVARLKFSAIRQCEFHWKVIFFVPF